MQTQSTYVGWDFNTIWEMDEGISYPRLRVCGAGTVTQQVKRMAGIEYEQVYSYEPGLTPPEINIINIDVLDFSKGIYRLSVLMEDCTLDSTANPFFFWSSTNGMFEDAKTAPDGSMTLIFKADQGTGDKDVIVIVGLGDGLGRIDRKVLALKGNDDQ
jgi:hypothetical protein